METRGASWSRVDCSREPSRHSVSRLTRTQDEGYNADMLSGERLRAWIPAGALGEHLYYEASLGSTNDRAKQLAESGCPDGTLVVADEQTAGPGRGRRTGVPPARAAPAFSV